MALPVNSKTVENVGTTSTTPAVVKKDELDEGRRARALEHRRQFFNYPRPLLLEDVRPRKKAADSPALIGWPLVVSARLMEWLSPARSVIWSNAGFGSLPSIRTEIEDYEPWYTPAVIPRRGDGYDLDATSATQQRTSPSTSSSSSGDHEQPETMNLPEESAILVNKTGPKVATRSNKPYTTRDYRALYLSGALTPVDVVQALLPRIRKDQTPQTLHSLAFSSCQEHLVLQAAEDSAQRYKEKRSIGPLDGVPCVVKDEYDIDGYRTHLGSRNDYTGEIENDDGTISTWAVRKLQEAGVVIIGKSTMVEFGLDTPGNNPIHGTPRNPYNSTYYTGGSSSGTAYIVSVGLVPIGLGSDGGGSIRIPAAMCGVFGLKPTHDRVSFAPGQNHATTCACLGPIATDVYDLALLLEVIAQPHPESDFPASPRYSTLLARSISTSPSRRIIGIPRAWFLKADKAAQDLCHDLVNSLTYKYDYDIVDVAFPFLDEGQMAHALTMLTDGATLLPKTSTLTPATRILLAIGRTTPSTDYLLAQKLRRALMQHLSALWAQHPGMLIVTPTTACAGWAIKSDTELQYGISDGNTTIRSMEFVWMANFLGLPSITVPAGFVDPVKRSKALKAVDASESDKIPVGLMAMGEWADEAALLRFGLEAQDLGEEAWVKPHGWVDVISEAKGRTTAN